MTLPKSYSQFAVYETFSPVALRNKVVLLAADGLAWTTELPPVLAMECARLGAHLALLAPDRQVYQPVATEITAYGRPVLELGGDASTDGADGHRRLIEQTLARYPRLDLMVTMGDEPHDDLLEAACTAMAAGEGGCAVSIAAPDSADGLYRLVAELHDRYRPGGVRVNGVLTPAVVEPAAAAASAQQIAWLVAFFASPAGASVAGQCLRMA